MTKRESFIKAMLEQMGLPYLWDGKMRQGPCDWNDRPGASEPYLGLDCSGAVTHALKEAGGPDWRSTYYTQLLWDSLPQVLGPPLPGDLCLYGEMPDGKIHHVMTLLGVGGLVVGAAGGDHTFTTTREDALRRGGCVQIWPSKDFMSGFAGYRRLPWLDQP